MSCVFNCGVVLCQNHFKYIRMTCYESFVEMPPFLWRFQAKPRPLVPPSNQNADPGTHVELGGLFWKGRS